MTSGIHEQCLLFAQEAIDAIQSGKEGATSLAVRKLELCAKLVEDKNLQRWANFTLDTYQSQLPATDFVDLDYAEKVVTKLQELKVPLTNDEIFQRLGDSGGGFNSIEFVERTLSRLNREKRGNDGTHFRNNVQKVIVATSNAAYTHAASWPKDDRENQQSLRGALKHNWTRAGFCS